MAAAKPLQGISLIDCAQSNAAQGIDVASRQCGFGADTDQFLAALKQAGQQTGLTIHHLEDLLADQPLGRYPGGLEIAPDTLSDL